MLKQFYQLPEDLSGYIKKSKLNYTINN